MSAKYSAAAAIILIMMTLALLSTSPAISQQDSSPTPTATPFPVRSLFAEDSCAPPCWFGLIPGESTSADVELFFQTFDEVFDRVVLWPESTIDSETGAVIQGYYAFRWRSENDHVIFPGNVVSIEDGIMAEIKVGAGRKIALTEVLDTLGPPDYITFTRGAYEQFGFYLHYWEPRLEVYLGSVALPNNCLVYNIREDFQMEMIIYFLPTHWPRILQSERSVPPGTWQSWLNGDESTTCYEAWRKLPEDATIPLPTNTSEPP